MEDSAFALKIGEVVAGSHNKYLLRGSIHPYLSVGGHLCCDSRCSAVPFEVLLFSLWFAFKSMFQEDGDREKYPLAGSCQMLGSCQIHYTSISRNTLYKYSLLELDVDLVTLTLHQGDYNIIICYTDYIWVGVGVKIIFTWCNNYSCNYMKSQIK